ncbi:MAG: glutamate racemase [Candidatus Omnitrophica bacterium]|nr:glutamate racemase [Candidatus Omnitrophota bacterium]
MSRLFQGRARDPIGVFDSGLGGLTVVKAIRALLPAEDIHYFGDLARLPYGTKSREQIIRFSVENTEFLLRRRVKALVVACNSSASAAYQILRKKYTLPIVDVITPAVREAVLASHTGRIGLIATKATVESGAYEQALNALNPKARVTSAPCPLFVPLVEEGMALDRVTAMMAQRYLKPLIRKKIDTLILGCTHYPLLSRIIKQVLPKGIHLVDSARPTVQGLAEILIQHGLKNTRKGKGRLSIFVSDKPRSFTELGERFLGEKLTHVEVVRS